MPRRKTKLWGLVSRQPRWGLTIQGWFGLLLAIACTFWLLLTRLEPFLAYSAPVAAEILITEGWITDEGIMGAMDEFERQPYELLITAGSNFGRGEYLSQYKDFAHLAEATLVTLGFDPQKIQPIPTPLAKRDQTLTSALEVKKWLQSQNITPKGINIYSHSLHSRRSWLTYKTVFAPEIPVGVIAHPAQTYDPQSWWASSVGFKGVVLESISYLYVKLFLL
ncbi:MAG: YdcF family protein [Cyanobacteria bacterium P01_G01_bin.39]